MIHHLSRTVHIVITNIKALYSELDDVFTLKEEQGEKKQHHRFFLLENILLANCLWHDFI